MTVARSWDVKAGPIEPKSQAGKRTVPIASVLREYLIACQLRSGRREGLVFGSSGTRPFTPSAVRRRALTSWKNENRKRRESELSALEPIALHECRHTFASLMIAAGVNAKALSVYMGHASVMITLDRYGHLFPGNEEEAAGLLDSYLLRETGTL
jgi:integrase